MKVQAPQQHRIWVKDTPAAVTCNPSEDTNAAAAKRKSKEKRNYARSQEKKSEKTRERDDEIRRLVEERRNTAKRDKHRLKELSKRIKKCIGDRKRTKRQ